MTICIEAREAMNKLRKIFCPSTEDNIAWYERIIELHNEQFGECSTCIHHISPDPTLPGFVTDYGSCKLDIDIFEKKVCSVNKVECDWYKNNTEFIESIKALLVLERSK